MEMVLADFGPGFDFGAQYWQELRSGLCTRSEWILRSTVQWQPKCSEKNPAI
jgi:hypothetical protein